MYKLFSTVVACVALSGCWQSVSVSDIEAANIICKGNSAEVVEISAYFDSGEVVTCSNRKRFAIREDRLNEAKSKLKEGKQ